MVRKLAACLTLLTRNSVILFTPSGSTTMLLPRCGVALSNEILTTKCDTPAIRFGFTCGSSTRTWKRNCLQRSTLTSTCLPSLRNITILASHCRGYLEYQMHILKESETSNVLEDACTRLAHSFMCVWSCGLSNIQCERSKGVVGVMCYQCAKEACCSTGLSHWKVRLYKYYKFWASLPGLYFSTMKYFECGLKMFL